MKKRMSRLLSFLLVVAMVCAMVPAVAAAGTVTGVTLDKQTMSLTLVSNTTGTLTPTVTTTGDASNAVTWTSGTPAVATVNNGVVTAIAAGTSVITATATADETKSATCTVTVYDNATGVTVQGKDAATTVELGGTLQMTATVAPETAEQKVTTWQAVSGTGSATIVSDTGILTGTALGTVTVNAKTANGKTGSCTITVIPAAKVLTSVTASKNDVTLLPGKTEEITVNNVFSNAEPEGLTSAPVASGVTGTSISCTAKPGAAGTYTIAITKEAKVIDKATYTFTTTLNGVTKSAIVNVTVKSPITGVTVTGNKTIKPGTPLTLTGAATVDNGADVNTVKTVTWSITSGNATVDTKGVVTTTAAAKTGDQIIVCATSTVDTSKYFEYTLTVGNYAISGIGDYVNRSFTANAVMTLEPKVEQYSGSVYFTYTSNNTSVVRTSTNANTASNKGTITFVNPGRTTVEVKAYSSASTQNASTLLATETITVSTYKSANVAVDVSSSSSYGFDERDSKGSTSLYNQVWSAIQSVYGQSTNDMVYKLDNLSSSSYGTLYNGSTTTSMNKYVSGTSQSWSSFDDMTFVPNSSGTYTANYTVMDKNQYIIAQGKLEIKADTTGYVDYNVASNSSVTLDEDDFYSYLRKSYSNATLDYVEFDTRSSATSYYGTSSYGYLYEDASSTSSSYQLDYDDSCYYQASSRQIDLDAVTFRPGSSSSKYTVLVPFTAYGTNNQKASGTLRIYVGEGTGYIDYTVASDASVTLDEDDFYDYLRKSYSNATLSYVEFDTRSSATSYYGTSSYGYLYETASSNSTIYYTDSCYYDASSRQIDLDEVTFRPGSSSSKYTVLVPFVAYGTSSSQKASGTLRIYVNESANYVDYHTTTNTNVTLDEDDFQDIFDNEYRNGSLDYVKFDVNSATKYGTSSYGYLYENATSSSSSYQLGKNDECTYDAGRNDDIDLDAVTYRPGTSTSEYTVLVPFTAYGTSSSQQVDGVLRIYVNENKNYVDYRTSSNTALTLKEEDFQDIFDDEFRNGTLSYVKFDVTSATKYGSSTYGYLYENTTSTSSSMQVGKNDECYYKATGSKIDLDAVTFRPGSSSAEYTVLVPFTAYGTTSSQKVDGVLRIYVNNSTGISIKSIGSSFKDASLVSKMEPSEATSKTLDEYYVEFYSATNCTLYYDYSTIVGATAITGTSAYYFEPDTNEKSLGKVYIVPDADAKTAEVKYTVYREKQSGESKDKEIDTGYITFTVSQQSSSNYFSDVTSSNTGSWSANAVDFMYYNSLVNGTGGKSFGPNGTMTRAMLVTILYRQAGEPSVSGYANPFKDVASSAYYYKAVLWAYKNNIVTGNTKTTFNPNGAVTREQIATILYRDAGSPSTSGSVSSYNDSSKVSSYALTAMKWAVSKGYIKGSGSYLKPTSSATRAEVAVMLHRYITK